MLRRSKSIFNFDEGRAAIKGYGSSNKSSVDPVGLRIVIESSPGESNIVIKSSLRLSRTNSTGIHGNYQTSFQEFSFLKACYLCKKQLSLDKDVYMYRGDQGFCSLECRCRQIFMDEMKVIEASTREILASSRMHCRTSDRPRDSSRRRRIPAAA